MLYMMGCEKSAKNNFANLSSKSGTKYLQVKEIADTGSTFNYLFSPVEPPLRKDPLEV